MHFFSKNVVFLRELKGLNQAQMAASIDFNKTTWNNYELGKSQPNITDLLTIADFFKVTASQLLELDLKKHDFSYKTKSKKLRGKYDLKGDYQGDFSAKKYPENNLLTVANEDPPSLFRMPQVITVDSQGNENVVMVPVRARAGYLNGYSDPEFMQSLPAYRLPGLSNGTFRLFEVEGQSMFPTLSAGDLVIGAYVEQLSLVRDDRVYVVVTKNDGGLVVKRVLNRLSTDGKLILKSDNYKDRELYPTMIVEPNNIVELWYVTGFISRQLRPPAEMYNRLIDLEGRFTLLEAGLKKADK
jgi:transcriptional regulator with XRE-family HTH domain/signal peptidase I